MNIRRGNELPFHATNLLRRKCREMGIGGAVNSRSNPHEEVADLLIKEWAAGSGHKFAPDLVSMDAMYDFATFIHGFKLCMKYVVEGGDGE